MIRVVLKDGRVLTYNQACNAEVAASRVILRTGLNGDWIASIGLDTIQRYECDRPCSIRREKAKRKLAVER